MKGLITAGYRRIFARPSLYGLNLHIFKLALRGLGILNSEGPAVTGEAWLCRILGRKMRIQTILDVGSNLDIFGLKEFPGADIYACEPHPETFRKMQLMKMSAENKRRLHLLNVALSDRKGVARLWDFAADAALKYTQPTSTLSSLDKAVIEDIHKQKAQSFKVRVTTVDDLVSGLKIGQIDILKIDTEGHELKVLAGAKKSIKQRIVQIILFEFNEMNTVSRVFLKDFLKILPDYRFFRLLPEGLVPLDDYRPVTHEIFGFQNIVCIKRELSGTIV